MLRTSTRYVGALNLILSGILAALFLRHWGFPPEGSTAETLGFILALAVLGTYAAYVVLLVALYLREGTL